VIAAAIAGAAVALAVLALVGWMARAMLTAVDARRVAEATQAGLAADLRVAMANVESFRRDAARQRSAAAAHKEIARVIRENPVLDDPTAHGLDRLSAALDAVTAIVPVPDRGAGGGRVGGGLLAPDWSAPGPVSDGPRPAELPDPGGSRDGA
jgi:hypothetical protein